MTCCGLRGQRAKLTHVIVELNLTRSAVGSKLSTQPRRQEGPSSGIGLCRGRCVVMCAAMS